MTQAKTTLKGWLRRRQSWFIAALVIISIPLVMNHLLPWVLRQYYGAKPVVAGGMDLSGAQVAVAQQSAGVPYGIIISKLLIAVLFYCVTLGMAWWSMHFTSPVLPIWAKADFKPTFLRLPAEWQHKQFSDSYRTQLFVFLACLLAASLIQ